jgi:hypothetical protein
MALKAFTFTYAGIIRIRFCPDWPSGTSGVISAESLQHPEVVQK